jgi:hypothetical protein
MFLNKDFLESDDPIVKFTSINIFQLFIVASVVFVCFGL